MTMILAIILVMALFVSFEALMASLRWYKTGNGIRDAEFDAFLAAMFWATFYYLS